MSTKGSEKIYTALAAIGGGIDRSRGGEAANVNRGVVCTNWDPFVLEGSLKRRPGYSTTVNFNGVAGLDSIQALAHFRTKVIAVGWNGSIAEMWLEGSPVTKLWDSGIAASWAWNHWTWALMGRALVFGVGYKETNQGGCIEVREDSGAFDARQLGVPKPTTTCTAAVGAATGLTGVYSYKVTFVYTLQDGTIWESNPSTKSNDVTLTGADANKKVDLTAIPVGAAGALVTARRLYRTVTGGAVWLYLTQISDNTTTTYTDSAADTTLGAAVPSKNTVPPRLLWALAAHNDRLWGLSTQSTALGGAEVRNRLYYSEAGQEEYWGVEGSPNYIDATPSGKDLPAMGLASWVGSLYVLNPVGIYVLRGYSPDLGWQMESVWDGTGASWEGTVAGSDYGIVYGSREGIHLFDGSQSLVISDALGDLVDFSDQVGATGIGADPQVFVHAGRYVYFWPDHPTIADAAMPTYVCDLATITREGNKVLATWTRYDHFPGRVMCDPTLDWTEGTLKGLLLSGIEAGVVSEFGASNQDVLPTAGTSMPNATYRTRHLSNGLPAIDKRFRRFLLDLEATSAVWALSVKVSVDDASDITLTAPTAKAGRHAYTMMVPGSTVPPGRLIEIELVQGDATGTDVPLTVHGIPIIGYRPRRVAA